MAHDRSNLRVLPWRRRLLAVVTVGLLSGTGSVFVAAGCTNIPPVPPKPCDVQVVTLNIYASDNINPNEKGNPRPVVVRLYQLKNDVRLQNAPYDDVLLREKEALGEDILKMDEVEIYPNDLVEVKFERMKEASILGGVALFHSPKGQSWKTFYSFPLPPGEAACAGRAAKDKDGGKPEADPRTAFFLESTKIDNGTQLDESMFQDAGAMRKIDLPKASAGVEGKGSAPGTGPAAR